MNEITSVVKDSSLCVKIGNTTYIVCVLHSATANKPLEKIIKDVCRHDVLGDFCAENLPS